MEEVAEVYARALFGAARDHDVLDEVRDELGQFADALNGSRDLMRFFFSPLFSSEEKKAALNRAVTGADPHFENFLQALIERHRMPVIFRIRTGFDKLWENERAVLPVVLTSAVNLDEKIVSAIGERIGKQTGRNIELSSNVDPD